MYTNPASLWMDGTLLQISSPASVLSPRLTKSPSTAEKPARWGRSKTGPRRMSTKECTSIVEGLKVIYFSKVLSCSPCQLLLVQQPVVWACTND